MECQESQAHEKRTTDREILKLFVKSKGCTLTDDNRILADDTREEVVVLGKWSYNGTELEADIQLKQALFYVATEIAI